MTVDRDATWRRSVERLWRRHGGSELLATVIDEPDAHVRGEPKLRLARQRLEAAGLTREVMQVVAQQASGKLAVRPVYLLLGVSERSGHVRELLAGGQLDWLRELRPVGAPHRAYVQTDRDGVLVGAIVSADGTVDVGRTAVSLDGMRRFFERVRAAGDPGDWAGIEFPERHTGFIHGMALEQRGEIGRQPYESLEEWWGAVR